MYAVIADPYCYQGTQVLKNRLGIRVQRDLDAFEAEATAQRFSEPLPRGRFSVRHYCAVHRHIFGDVYAWAGRFRSVRIAKGNSMFAYPEHIPSQMKRLFKALPSPEELRRLPKSELAKEVAYFLAELNAIHPFRDGNGRTQLAFISLLAFETGYVMNIARLKPAPFLKTMIASFNGQEEPLERALLALLRKVER